MLPSNRAAYVIAISMTTLGTIAAEPMDPGVWSGLSPDPVISPIGDMRLAVLAESIDCFWICDYCDEDETEHLVFQTTDPDAGYDANHTEFCVTAGSCEDHECGPDQQDQPEDESSTAAEDTRLEWFEQVRLVISSIPESPLEDLSQFLALNSDVVILNRARQSIQFLGCNGQVVAQVPLARTTVVALLDAAFPTHEL